MLHARRYQDVAQSTASRERLLVLLLRAALTSMETVHAAFLSPESAPPKRVADALDKAQAIVAELQATLDPRQAPALTATLADVYAFVAWRLTTAQTSHEAADVADAIRSFLPIVTAFEQVVGGSDARR